MAPAGARAQGNGGGAAASAERVRASRSRAALDAPRGAPRAALAPAAPAADRATAQRAEAAAGARRLRIGSFEDLIALAAREARPRRQARARTRRAARALRGRPARNRAGAERRQDAGQRSFAQALAVDQPALDGRRLGGAGRADGARRRTKRAQAELKTGVRADPLVQAVLARFPGAEIVDVRKPTRRRAAERRCRTTRAESPPVDDGRPMAPMASRRTTSH